jgi:hypothetical protein
MFMRNQVCPGVTTCTGWYTCISLSTRGTLEKNRAGYTCLKDEYYQSGVQVFNQLSISKLFIQPTPYRFIIELEAGIG